MGPLPSWRLRCSGWRWALDIYCIVWRWDDGGKEGLVKGQSDGGRCCLGQDGQRKPLGWRYSAENWMTWRSEASWLSGAKNSRERTSREIPESILTAEAFILPEWWRKLDWLERTHPGGTLGDNTERARRWSCVWDEGDCWGPVHGRLVEHHKELRFYSE